MPPFWVFCFWVCPLLGENGGQKKRQAQEVPAFSLAVFPIFALVQKKNCMLLIAESGSTKTDWRAVSENGNITQFLTAGFNPFHQNSQAIAAEIQNKLLPSLNEKVLQVHFYGAGCSTKTMCDVVASALAICFPDAKIVVEHDLLAAARALCGRQAGIACILGTGSNSCVFDGEKITANIPSLGYILGDEGSGAYMGKQFLADFLTGNLPQNLANDFSEKFGLDKEKILEAVYRQPMPNRFLASFGKYFFQRTEQPYIIHLLKKSFTDFFERQVCRYPEHTAIPVHFTGSIAYYFSAILKTVAEEKNIHVGTIIESPAAALVLYHTGVE